MVRRVRDSEHTLHSARSAHMVDVHDPSHPECALQPAPEAAEVYAIKRAEYLQGLEYFERREYDLALSLFTALFNELQSTLAMTGGIVDPIMHPFLQILRTRLA